MTQKIELVYFFPFIIYLQNEINKFSFLGHIDLQKMKVINRTFFQNALLSGMPYLGMWIFSILVSAVVDFARKRNYVSTTVARKIANSIGNRLSL